MAFWRDIRFGIRTLRHAQGFAITSVITIALGIGATTAVYSLADGMLWKPVPLPGLDQLVMIMERIPNESRDWNWDSAADALDIRRQAGAFSGIAEWDDDMANIVGSGGEPERVDQYLVSANFFDVVGVHPTLGRGFQPGEDQPGRERVVVLSDALWRRSFGGNPEIVGRSIRLDDEDYVVTGVMPPQFTFPKAGELWTPLALKPDQRNTRTNYHVAVMGRLKPGVTVAQAGTEIDAISARLAREYPDTNKNRRFTAIPLHQYIVGPYNHDYVMLLFYAVLFVLMIACVNVANLQFARATGRSREIAVRTALGAGRGRVIVQLLTESVMLALCGAALGLVVATWGLDLIRTYMPPEVEKYVVGWKNIRLDGRALAFTLLAAVASGIISGLAPAWQSSRTNLHDCLKEGGRGSTVGRARHRLRGLLVGAEVALAVVLLVGAGLMVRGFQTILAGGSRFEPDTLLTMRMTLTRQKYPKDYQRAAFYRELLERTARIPGVRASFAATALPYSDHSSGETFRIEGKPVEDQGHSPAAMYQLVSPNYFQVLHVPLLAGRLLADSDGAESPAVVVISEKLARQWWPGEPFPIGKRIQIGRPGDENSWTKIVGVVGNVPHDFFEREPRAVLYVPFVQAPRLFMDIGIRTAGNPLQVAQAVTAATRSLDPEQPITDLCTMDTLRHRNGLGLAYVATMMAVFGVLALILAAVGVYGVMAYLVSHQTHEIGVRMALGAPRSSVLKMVFRRGLLTTVAGLFVGLVLSYKLADLMASLLFGVTATDPATFLGIPAVLMATAAVAIYLPARRAMKIDPIRALRYE